MCWRTRRYRMEWTPLSRCRRQDTPGVKALPVRWQLPERLHPPHDGADVPEPQSLVEADRPGIVREEIEPIARRCDRCSHDPSHERRGHSSSPELSERDDV